MFTSLVQLLSDLCGIVLVLANHGLFRPHGLQEAEDLELVAEDLLRAAESLGHLHGQQGHDLSEMVLHHISDHTVLVVEWNPTFEDKQKKGIKYTFLVKGFCMFCITKAMFSLVIRKVTINSLHFLERFQNAKSRFVTFYIQGFFEYNLHSLNMLPVPDRIQKLLVDFSERQYTRNNL